MKNNILMCVPTRNRAQMVEEVLCYEMSYYQCLNIQLCYYDSSDNDDTYEVINKINKLYSNRILYRRSNPKLCLDYKLIEILKDFEKSEYEYLWLVNDSVSIQREMLEVVIKLINGDKNFDLLRLPLSGTGEQEDYICTDVNEWFFKCSQGMAHMASTIMSQSLLRQEHDWQFLSEKYVYNNELDNKHGYFFMVAFYLEQIAKLPNFQGIFIGNRVKWRRDSPLKKEHIYWREKVFATWAKSYPETILKLPELYTMKEEVIRKSDNILPGRFSKEMLIHYRLNGLYDWAVYREYKSYFKYITTEKKISCFMISILPLFFLKIRYNNLKTIEGEWIEKLNIIEKSIGKREIIIYGAGLYGEKVISKLQEDGYGNQIIGVAVTEKKGNLERVCGIRVKSIDEYNMKKKSALVIISVLPAMAEEIRKELKKRKFKHCLKLFGV